MSEKIVALNSGGLDSVVMLHELRETNPDTEIHTIFFSYGQRAYVEELICASKVASKLNLEFEVIELPKMDWSNSGLLEETEDVYLEMRNMIFLSYAISYAEAIKSKKVYVAFIEPLGYYDTTYEFVENMNKVIKGLEIEIIAPLHKCPKEALISPIRVHCIEREDFFSCLKTEEITGKKCGNCEVIDYMYENFIDPYLLDDLFWKRDFKRFNEVKKATEVKTAKMEINDRCNLKCSYCHIEGEKPKELSLAGYKEVLDKLYEMGIENVDIFGKEPLFDSKIFDLVKYSREQKQGLKFTFITNGVNIEKYYDDIIEANFESMSVSYEGDIENSGRNFVPDLKILARLIADGVKLNISLDLHKHNAKNIYQEYVPMFKEMGVNEIYIKPIISVGKNKENVVNDFMLSPEEFKEVIDKLEQEDYKTRVVVGIPLQYNDLALEIMEKLNLYTNTFKGVFINHDLYCYAGIDSIYVDSLADVYGCGYMKTGCNYKSPYNLLENDSNPIV